MRWQPVRVESDPTSVEVRTPTAHIPTIVAGCGVTLVGVSLIAPVEPNGVFMMVLGTAALIVGVWTVRSSSRACIRLTEDRLIESGDLIVKTVPTTQVAEFFVDRTPHVVPWFSIWARLGSGELRALEQCRVLELRPGAGHRGLLDASESLNRWLAER
jgi:hypothetical protein